MWQVYSESFFSIKSEFYAGSIPTAKTLGIECIRAVYEPVQLAISKLQARLPWGACLRWHCQLRSADWYLKAL